MIKRSTLITIAIKLLGLLFSCQIAKGTKCGPDHVWVPGHRTANGARVYGWCWSAAKIIY
ncbi:MAG: hypothetical protein JRI53_10945 [Deltaproteobacteria bacterium]|nr:hypothetical protein [Deltaproteobacteria bacterium]MBW1985224.1 hypothetical protein [Deltaproteobacteria bacterium]